MEQLAGQGAGFMARIHGVEGAEVWVSGASKTVAGYDLRQASDARDLGLCRAEEGKPLSLQQLPEVEDGVAQEIASAE